VDIKAHLKEITELPGPSGYEMPVRDALAKAWQPLVDSVENGKFNTLIATKYGSGTEPRPRIMLTAHIDENALIVNKVEHGLIGVKAIGGPDARTLPGTPVIVYGREQLKGVIGVVPLNRVADAQKTKYPALKDLIIDVGRPAEEVAKLVRVGDLVVPDLPMLELENGRVAGKAMDDRSCIAAITTTLDQLQSRKHQWDVIAFASTQEEATFMGAEFGGKHIFPDLAIALDVTFGNQPGAGHGSFKLGDGPTLGLGPNFHPALYKAMMKTADRLEITVHSELAPGHSGTDAWPIQVAREGVPSGLVGLATQSMHTAVETVDLKDIERIGRWLAEFIAELPANFLDNLVWDEDEDKNEGKGEGEKND
jgi:endoglucanase